MSWLRQSKEVTFFPPPRQIDVMTLYKIEPLEDGGSDPGAVDHGGHGRPAPEGGPADRAQGAGGENPAVAAGGAGLLVSSSESRTR